MTLSLKDKIYRNSKIEDYSTLLIKDYIHILKVMDNNPPNTMKKRENERQDPHDNRERISAASSRDVSPNTPKGEDV
jgi:hypothetical protein